MENAIYMLCGADKNLEDWHKDDLLNSFIITSESGKVVLIDGGHRFNAARLLEKLKEVTGQEKPKVDAWFLTHIHSDHIYAFIETMEKHADEIDVEKIYYNFPTDLSICSREGDTCAKLFLEFYSLEPKIRAKSYIPRMGETIEIGDIKFEILYTQGLPLKVNSVNNTSLVMKMYLGGKSTIFLADSEVEAGRILLEKYGLTGQLKSDICQMAHHGQCGVEKRVYEAIKPEICLWNTPKWLWDNDLGKGFNTAHLKTVEVRGWMIDELGVKTHYIIKDGDQVCKL